MSTKLTQAHTGFTRTCRKIHTKTQYLQTMSDLVVTEQYGVM